MIQGIGVCYIRDNIKMKSYLKKTGGYQPPAFFKYYAAFCIGICDTFNIFSIKIPYPVVGSFTIT